MYVISYYLAVRYIRMITVHYILFSKSPCQISTHVRYKIYVDSTTPILHTQKKSSAIIKVYFPDGLNFVLILNISTFDTPISSRMALPDSLGDS